MKFETSGKIREETKLPPEQQKLVDERGKKVKALFDAFEKGGGQPEVQEAKLRLKDLKESLEIHKKVPLTDSSREDIKWYEREIELNQRVVNGENLVDVLDSMKSEDDKKRIEEAKRHHSKMKQL